MYGLNKKMQHGLVVAGTIAELSLNSYNNLDWATKN